MQTTKAADLINHPPHYLGRNGIKSIDVIERYGLGFALGNALKYLLRAGRKGDDALTDLQKAEWYLARWLDARGADEVWTTSTGANMPGCGLTWRTPAQVADAFDLTLNRRLAVTTILASTIEQSLDAEERAVAGALEQVRAAIKYDEVGQ